MTTSGEPQAFETVTESRRRFLVTSGAAAAAATVFGHGASAPAASEAPAVAPGQDETPAPDAPPGPEITRGTIAEAEKLAGVEYTDAERDQIAASIEGHVRQLRARDDMSLPNGLAPAQVFDPRLPDMILPRPGPAVWSEKDPGRLPADEVDIAFAPVTQLSQWIARGDLTSTRLTGIYLDRLKRLGPKLECVVTLTEDLARRQAARADAETAAGQRRGPLHGIPWGAKDLLDTAGIPTTWGAAPFRGRVPETDAYTVQRLDEAGAVLVAKLTLGALAYGDIWFGGKTRNPWNLEQGSSGSSAGPAAATVAGLVGFSIGTETLGSIVSPCMRCGATGLRPTFGRVARTGAMALCWSLDKIGPICRTVEDTAIVLSTINGADDGDPSSRDEPFAFNAREKVDGLRLGYDPRWFEGRRATDLDRNALDVARATGVTLTEMRLPDLPYRTLMTILHAEAAAAFEEITLDGRDDDLAWQEPEAWPNTFRRTRFIPAIEYVQAERFRRRVMQAMRTQFEDVNAIISPSYAGSLLLITNNTGHPSLTLPCGFKENGTPHGITLWGRLYDEATICRIGMALEKRLGVRDRRPPMAATR